MRNTLAFTPLTAALVAVLLGCATPNPDGSNRAATNEPLSPGTQQVETAEDAGPVEYRLRPGELAPPVQPDGIVSIEVPNEITEPAVRYFVSPEAKHGEIRVTDVPRELDPNGKGLGQPDVEGEQESAEDAQTPLSVPSASPQDPPAHSNSSQAPPMPQAPAFDSIIDAADFDTNGVYTPYLFIPPDPHAAAGSNHVVDVVNVLIQFYQKDGTLDFEDSLRNFFAALSPVTYTFDPKVIYDQYADRFVVVTLEQTSSPQTSRILVAVSDDANPNGMWYLTEINSRVQIGGYRWADYPGLGLDSEGIYITANMFPFNGSGTSAVRLWSIDKGLGSAGFYDGGLATITLTNPYGGGGSAATTQPAHFFDTGPSNVSSFLVSYSGLSDGTNEYVQVVRWQDPFGTPSFFQQYINVGDIEDFVSFPLAPQAGTANAIATNDHRALNAVWRDDTLWMTATTSRPDVSGPYETFATWWQIDTTNLGSLALVDQGFIDGEDIATGTFTFFPSIAVTSTGEIAIGFAASAPSIFPGSYYTTRSPGDPAGTTTGSQVLRAGTDWYWRQFSGTRNRWGDYTAVSVDPVDECFWVFNEHAITRGTVTSGGQDGRWATAHGRACACDQSLPMTANLWYQVSIACDQGTALTVDQVFGDDLAGSYGTDWGMYGWNPATSSYSFLSITDTLAAGTGYWLSTHNAAQTVDCQGVFNNEIDVALTSDPAGRFNMVGHPFEFDVCWADAEVIDSDDSVLTLDQADPSDACQQPDPLTNGCVMSRIAYKWTGAVYASFNGTAPGVKGTLEPFNGFWVKAFKPGIKLRVPAIPGSSCEAAAAPVTAAAGSEASDQTRSSSWYIRLIATAGFLEDSSAVFGYAPGSRPGYDANDLPRLQPFGSIYLNVVFPHSGWQDRSGDYATDFRSPQTYGIRDYWPFEIRTSAIGEKVTLQWEGPKSRIGRARLWDQEQRRLIPVRPDGSYSYTATSGTRRFLWIQGN